MQGSESTPKAPLGNNARPVQTLHHRTVRTNIDFKRHKVSVGELYIHIYRYLIDMIFIIYYLYLVYFFFNFNFCFDSKQNQNACPSMYKDMYYRANRWSPDTGLLIRWQQKSTTTTIRTTRTATTTTTTTAIEAGYAFRILNAAFKFFINVLKTSSGFVWLATFLLQQQQQQQQIDKDADNNNNALKTCFLRDLNKFH